MTKTLQIHTSSPLGSSPVHGSIYEFLGYGTGRYCSDVWLTCTDIFIDAFTFTVEYMWAESPCSMYIGHMHKAVSHRNERFCSRSLLTIANLAIRPQRAKQWVGSQQIFDVGLQTGESCGRASAFRASTGHVIQSLSSGLVDRELSPSPFTLLFLPSPI